MPKKVYGFLLAVCLVGAQHGLAQGEPNAQRATNIGAPLDKMPTSLEVRFALSALPRALRENAAVYVLDPAKGYVLQRAGSNGQSCFVGRTEWKFADYRNDIYDPICYDPVGAKNHMRVWFDVEELRAKGVSPDAMKKEIEARFHNGSYRAPDHAGFSYMTAPLMRTYLSLDSNDKNTVATKSMPHVMYYAPNITDVEVGGMPCPPAFLIRLFSRRVPTAISFSGWGTVKAPKSLRTKLIWSRNSVLTGAYGAYPRTIPVNLT
jgi:hypothetical protein